MRKPLVLLQPSVFLVKDRGAVPGSTASGAEWAPGCLNALEKAFSPMLENNVEGIRRQAFNLFSLLYVGDSI